MVSRDVWHMGRRRMAWLLTGAIGLMAILFFPFEFGDQPRWIYYLSNLVHLPLYGVAALLGVKLFGAIKEFTRFRWGLMLFLFSFAIECLQPLTGRHFELFDLVLNALGIGLVLSLFGSGLLFRPIQVNKVGGVFTVLTLLLILPVFVLMGDLYRARRQYPLLCNFEGRLDAGRWKTRGCEIRRVPSSLEPGTLAGEVTIVESDLFPASLDLIEAAYPWPDFGALCFRIGVDGSEPLILGLRLIDQGGDLKQSGAFQRKWLLQPGLHNLCLQADEFVAKSGRRLDLSAIIRLSFFFKDAKTGSRVIIDEIHIVQQQDLKEAEHDKTQHCDSGVQ